MEFLLLASMLGACVRIGRSHDDRDRLTRLLLDRLDGAPWSSESSWQKFRTPRFNLKPDPLYQWQITYLGGLLDDIHLPYEAYRRDCQASCLKRCAAKKWIDFEFRRSDAPSHCELKLTIEGSMELVRLRQLLPPIVPVVRLVSR